MYRQVWQLEDKVAKLDGHCFSALIDLVHPTSGLVDVEVASKRFANVSLLGVDVPSFSSRDADEHIDPYARGSEMVVNYGAREPWPIDVGVKWHVMSSHELEAAIAAVDMVISVRTRLLSGSPELSVRSSVPASDVLQLVDADTLEFRSLVPPTHSAHVLRPDAGIGCLLFRIGDSDLTYAEMVHPLDFQCDELHGSTDLDSIATVQHRLFQDKLEKGVLLRARVRGVFVDRLNDEKTVADCYSEFVNDKLPLAT